MGRFARWLPHRWTSTHRRETARERALCEGRRAVAAVRGHSAWLKRRPFSDRFEDGE